MGPSGSVRGGARSNPRSYRDKAQTEHIEAVVLLKTELGVKDSAVIGRDTTIPRGQIFSKVRRTQNIMNRDRSCWTFPYFGMPRWLSLAGTLSCTAVCRDILSGNAQSPNSAPPYYGCQHHNTKMSESNVNEKIINDCDLWVRGVQNAAFIGFLQRLIIP